MTGLCRNFVWWFILKSSWKSSKTNHVGQSDAKIWIHSSNRNVNLRAPLVTMFIIGFRRDLVWWFTTICLSGPIDQCELMSFNEHRTHFTLWRHSNFVKQRILAKRDVKLYINVWDHRHIWLVRFRDALQARRRGFESGTAQGGSPPQKVKKFQKKLAK